MRGGGWGEIFSKKATWAYIVTKSLPSIRLKHVTNSNLIVNFILVEVNITRESESCTVCYSLVYDSFTLSIGF